MDTITERTIGDRYYLYGLSSSNTPKSIRYIGFTLTPEKRLNEHIRDCNRSKINTYKKNWIKKELKSGNTILMTILNEYEVRDDVILAEINTIKLFMDAGINLVNGTLGGDGVVCTDDVRIKLSNAKKNFKHSEETKLKLKNIFTGRKHSKETKHKMSVSRKGKCGRIWTKEERIKLSKSLKGKPSQLKGRIISDETKAKISLTKTGIPSKKRKRVQQLNKNYELIHTFPSLIDATIKTKINNIHRCINGGRKTAGGYIWKYE